MARTHCLLWDIYSPTAPAVGSRCNTTAFVRDYSDTSVRQGSAFGRVMHDRDHVLACPEQLQDSVTPDASRGSEDNNSTHSWPHLLW